MKWSDIKLQIAVTIATSLFTILGYGLWAFNLSSFNSFDILALGGLTSACLWGWIETLQNVFEYKNE